MFFQQGTVHYFTIGNYEDFSPLLNGIRLSIFYKEEIDVPKEIKILTDRLNKLGKEDVLIIPSYLPNNIISPSYVGSVVAPREGLILIPSPRITDYKDYYPEAEETIKKLSEQNSFKLICLSYGDWPRESFHYMTENYYDPRPREYNNKRKMILPKRKPWKLIKKEMKKIKKGETLVIKLGKDESIDHPRYYNKDELYELQKKQGFKIIYVLDKYLVY